MGFPSGWRRSLLPVFLFATAAAYAGCNGGDVAFPETTGEGSGTGKGPKGGTETPGETEPGNPDPADCIEPACASNKPLPFSAHAVRLTHAQWAKTVRDLLQLAGTPTPSLALPADPSAVLSAGEFGTDSGGLVVSPELWSAYRSAALELATALVDGHDGDVGLNKILPDAAKTGTVASRITAFVTDFLPKAFRRPVTPSEITRYVQLGDAVLYSEATADAFKLRVYWIVSAILQSPHFLYRVEGGQGSVVKGRLHLTPHETASKLSYALWGTMPDATIFTAASAGHLSTTADVAALAKQMVQDPRIEDLLANFHDTLFETDKIQGLGTRAGKPGYYDNYPKDAAGDMERTLQELVVKNTNARVKELYSSTTAYVTTPLAQVYGIDPATVPGIGPTTFAKATMPNGRVGILGHVGWLGVRGRATDTDPDSILRGVFATRSVLCLPLAGAPPNVVRPDPSTIAGATNRERVSRETAPCGDGCHGGAGGKINPLGFAFEHFDGLGIYREREKPLDPASPLIDAKGSIDILTKPFNGIAELMSQVQDSSWAHACYAAHWSAFLNGTKKVDAESRWLSPIIAKSMAGATIRELVVELVQQDAFLTVSDPKAEP